jgi:hypothetical protein
MHIYNEQIGTSINTSRRKKPMRDPPSCTGGRHPNTMLELPTSSAIGADGASGGPGSVLNSAADDANKDKSLNCI